jgi:hypothetical protein
MTELELKFPAAVLAWQPLLDWQVYHIISFHIYNKYIYTLSHSNVLIKFINSYQTLTNIIILLSILTQSINEIFLIILALAKVPMLDLFLKWQKPLNLSCFHSEGKPMLDLFPKWQKPLKLGCFRSEQKLMLNVVSKMAKTIEIRLLSQWTKANVWHVFWNGGSHWIWFLLQWVKANVGLVSKIMKTIEFGLFSRWAKDKVGHVSGVAKNH